MRSAGNRTYATEDVERFLQILADGRLDCVFSILRLDERTECRRILVYDTPAMRTVAMVQMDFAACAIHSLVANGDWNAGCEEMGGNETRQRVVRGMTGGEPVANRQKRGVTGGEPPEGMRAGGVSMIRHRLLLRCGDEFGTARWNFVWLATVVAFPR